MKNLILAIGLSLSFNGNSQCYKIINNPVMAKYKVYFTTNKSEATILGYKVNSYTECVKPGLIYLAPIQFTMATPIHKVKTKEEADIVIYWVKTKDEAKWL